MNVPNSDNRLHTKHFALACLKALRRREGGDATQFSEHIRKWQKVENGSLLDLGTNESEMQELLESSYEREVRTHLLHCRQNDGLGCVAVLRHYAGQSQQSLDYFGTSEVELVILQVLEDERKNQLREASVDWTD